MISASVPARADSKRIGPDCPGLDADVEERVASRPQQCLGMCVAIGGGVPI
jgi:hypothetical protein